MNPHIEECLSAYINTYLCAEHTWLVYISLFIWLHACLYVYICTFTPSPCNLFLCQSLTRSLFFFPSIVSSAPLSSFSCSGIYSIAGRIYLKIMNQCHYLSALLLHHSFIMRGNLLNASRWYRAWLTGVYSLLKHIMQVPFNKRGCLHYSC